MDPRPYHYEYRRPRLNNPTYQSTNLYGSLYHRDTFHRYLSTYNPSYIQPQNPSKYQNHNQFPQSQRKNQYIEKYTSKFIQKNQPVNKKISKSIFIDHNNPQFSRPNSNRSNKSQTSNQKQQRSSILASYGRNSMIEQKQRSFTQQAKQQRKINQNTGAYDKINQFTVYQRQQKPYNIIGNYPRSTSNELKKYPKLSLQFKLIEEGRYVPQ